MHPANRLFWERCQKKYVNYFKDPSKVVEFGSGYINGTIRDYFECADYTGVDWRQAKHVDLISLAHEVSFAPETFDTVVSASMLEHDPHWMKSLNKMVSVMKHDGIFVISWGAALNGAHGFDEAPDGRFHSLKAGYVIDLLELLGMYIHEFQYERTLLLESHGPETAGLVGLARTPLGMGEAVLVAFKDEKFAIGNKIIESLWEVDKP